MDFIIIFNFNNILSKGGIDFMKRIHLVLIQCGLIAFTAQAYSAAAVVPPTETCTSALCSLFAPGGLYFGVTGIYGEPNETGLGLATDSWSFGSPLNFTSENRPVSTSRQWDYKFTLGFDFPDNSNNIEINYLSVNNSAPAFNTYSSAAVFASYLFPNFVLPDPGSSFVSDAHLKYTIDQADISVGHYFGNERGPLRLHPFMGLRYANIEHSLTFAAPGYANSQFDGVGPLFGIDAHYGNWNGFGLVGHLDTALLIGSINSSTWLGLGGSFNFESGKTDRVVGSMTGKLGLDFTWVMQNNSLLTAEAGYQINEYFDSSDVVHGNTFTRAVTDIQTDNVSYNGPYLTLAYHM